MIKDLRDILLCGLIAFLIVFVVVGISLEYNALGVVQQAEATLLSSQETIIEAKKRLVDTSQNTNAVLIQAGIAMDETRRAATEQRQYWAKTAQETTLTVAEMRKLVGDTNKTLNGEIRDVSQEAQVTLIQVQKQVANLEVVTANAANAARHTDELITSPEVKTITMRAAIASVELAKASESAANSAADVEKVVHRVTRPKTLMVRFGSSMLGLSGKVWSLFVH